MTLFVASVQLYNTLLPFISLFYLGWLSFCQFISYFIVEENKIKFTAFGHRILNIIFKIKNYMLLINRSH